MENNEEPTDRWNCSQCDRDLARYRGQGDQTCECGAEYNAFGQRLRDDWRGNASTWDEDVSDMDGFEAQQAAFDREYDC